VGEEIEVNQFLINSILDCVFLLLLTQFSCKRAPEEDPGQG
jgi:hypothetical protein